MKSFKKLLAVVLSLAMVLGTLTVTAMAEGNVAEVTVGGVTTQYATIEDAFAAVTSADSEATVKMLDDTSYTSAITVTQTNYAVTLDLNGKTITAGAQLKLKTSKGFTIEDSSTEGTGKITTTLTSCPNGFIYNNVGATLTINGGMIESAQTGGYLVAGSGYKAQAIVINGGTFKADGAILVRSNTNTSGTSGGDLTINAGTFYGDPTSAKVTTSVKGTKTITGTVTDNQDGTWIVTAAADVAEVTINGVTTSYKSFDSAITAAKEATTATVKLLADCEKTEKVTTIAAGKDITLDLNGFALTNTHDVTIEDSGAASTNNRYFSVAGTLTITDTSEDKTGSIKANDAYTAKAAIAYANGGKVYVTGGTFYAGEAAPESTNACWMNYNGGTTCITGGWFSEWARPTNSSSYVGEGYTVIEVSDASKSATPYTVTNTSKTFAYNKNAADATGSVTSDTVYYLDGYTSTEVLNAKTSQFTYSGYNFMGWSTDAQADPDSPDLIAAGAVINYTDSKYGATNTFYAIWKEVTTDMWVCVNTADPTQGWASIAAAFADGCQDVTLIKDYTERDTISSGSGRLNLNGYNIIPNDAEHPTGSAIVIKRPISIYNEDNGPITVGGKEVTFGGEGKIEGYAQGTGGAIDASGSDALVKIYSGTFTGDAPNHGTVLTCSSGGQYYIYGGTFTPANSESQISAYYTGAGSIFVLGGLSGEEGASQSDVKMSGAFETYSASSGTVGIAGGYFSEVPSPANAAKIGTWDATSGAIVADTSLSIIANTSDPSYPYSVGATPWKITYNLNGGENNTANPATVAKDDASIIILQPATKTGYTFTDWTDADGNIYTTLKGTQLQLDLTLTANFEATTYTITYEDTYDATNTNPTTYTIEDNITLVDAERPTTNYYLSKWTLGSKTGEQVTGWNAGEKTGDLTIYANWSTYQAEVGGVKYKTFEEAVEAAKAVEGTATINLFKDITLKERYDLRGGTCSDFVIDLNGNNITKTFTKSGIIIFEGTLTITGNGTVKDNSSNEATDTSKRTIACEGVAAELIIEGGTYEGFAAATSNASAQEGNEGAGATIVAGTFSFDPSTDATSTLKEGGVVETNEGEGETPTITYEVYVAAASVTPAEGEPSYYKFMYSSDETKSAFDHIVDGCTVKLYKDASSAHKFSENMTFTLNLNGFKYEKAASGEDPAKTLEDLLTVADGHEILFDYSEDKQVVTIRVIDEEIFNITYVLGAGTNDINNPATYTQSTPTITLKDATPSDEGYSFQGWYTAADGGNRVTEIAQGSTDAITLYARYSNVTVATVNVDGSPKNFVSIAAAVDAAIANAIDGVATVTLTGNDLDDTIVVKDTDVNVVIDFNGKTVNAASAKTPLIVESATVKIDSSATSKGNFEINKAILVNEYGLLEIARVNTHGVNYLDGSTRIESKGIILNGTSGAVLPASNQIDQQASAARITTFGATLSDSINPSVNFYFAAKTGTSDTPMVKVEGPNGTEYVEAKEVTTGSGIYTAQLASLTPNQLAEEITFTVVASDGEGGYTEISKSKTMTMLEYFEKVAADERAKGESMNSYLISLLADAAKYGSELQKYMGEGTAFDVPTSLAANVSSWTPTAANNIKATTTTATDPTNFKIVGASLNIDTKVSVFFIVYATNSDACLHINLNGTPYEYQISEATVINSMGDNYYRIQMCPLTALQYGDTITADLTDAMGITYHAIEYSVNSYCYQMSLKDPAPASYDLTLAIYRYGVSAKNYKDSKM